MLLAFLKCALRKEFFGLCLYVYHWESLLDCLDTSVHVVSLGECGHCCCSLHATLLLVRKGVGQDMPLGRSCFRDLQ